MAKAFGIINSSGNHIYVEGMQDYRPIGAFSFLGRYRIIDFQLSNMVNSGITTVGLVTNNNYRSLIDHLGSGKDWDLARKDGGIILLPPFSEKSGKLYTNRLEALSSMTSFLNKRQEEYVVLSDCDSVAKFDISSVIAYHQSKKSFSEYR